MTPAAGTQLAITASGRFASCALRLVDGSVITSDGSGERQRGTDLAMSVAALFERAGVSRESLTHVLLDVGPGSYTGLRIALTFARFLASFGGAGLAVVTSLELLALAARTRGDLSESTPVRPVLDARRERFHTVRIEGGTPIAMSEAPRALPLDALTPMLRNDEIVIADDDVQRTLRDALGSRKLEAVCPSSIEARDLFDTRLAPRVTTPAELEPLYLMGSYAEPS